MKKLILLIVMFLLLLGGTIGSLMFLETGPFKPKKGEIKKIKQKTLKDTTQFIDMDPLAMPIFRGNRVAATIQIQIKLETNNKDKAEEINEKMPILTDAFIRDLHSFMPRLLRVKERVDVLIIKQRLQMVSDRVLGKGIVSNVLVQSLINQPR